MPVLRVQANNKSAWREYGGPRHKLRLKKLLSRLQYSVFEIYRGHQPNFEAGHRDKNGSNWREYVICNR